MLKTIVQCFFMLSLIFNFFSCKESKTPEVNKETLAAKSVEGSKSKNTAETKSEVSSSSLINYEIPEWPIKPKGGTGKLYPFDDASKDADFVKFRQKLYNVIRAKNVNRFLALVSDKIHFSFGEDAGKENFIKSWELDTAPNDSKIWNELAMCLELGGKFNFYDNKKRYAAPYVYMIEAFEDPYEEGVVIGDNVRLREKPNSNAKIIGSLSWDHVEIEYEENATKETLDGEENYWMNLKTLKGEKGYAYGKYVRTPVDYRVGFVEEEAGKWMIEFFIAGD